MLVQVSSQEFIGKVPGKSLAVNPWKSQVEPMWHQSGLGQRWAGNWNTMSIDWCLCNTTSCSCVQGSHCFLVNRALLDATAYVLLESNAAVLRTCLTSYYTYWFVNVCNSEVPHWPYIFHTTGSCCIAYLVYTFNNIIFPTVKHDSNFHRQ